MYAEYMLEHMADTTTVAMFINTENIDQKNQKQTHKQRKFFNRRIY